MISNTNVEMWECIFINFLQYFFFRFYPFLLTFNFLMLTNQEQELKTPLPKKLLGVRSRLHGAHENVTCLAIRL